MSELLQFTLENLSEFEYGKPAAAFEQHVRRAANDCLDRPGDPTARTITMTIELKPVMSQAGDCAECNARILVSSKVPPHHTAPISMGLRKNGVLVFNRDSPNNVDQSTFLED